MRSSRLFALVLAASLILASQAEAAITLLGSAQAQTGNGNTAVTTASQDTTGATLLVAVCFRDTGGTTAMSDSKSNTWAQAVITPSATGVAGVRADVQYVKNPSSVGSGHTFTCGGTASFASIVVLWFSGTDTSANVDQTNSNNGGAPPVTSITTGSATPSANNEAVIVVLGADDNEASFSLSTCTGCSIDQQHATAAGTAYGFAVGHVIQTTAAAVNATWTPSSSDGSGMSAGIATFKAAGAAPAVIRHRATTN